MSIVLLPGVIPGTDTKILSFYHADQFLAEPKIGLHDRTEDYLSSYAGSCQEQHIASFFQIAFKLLIP
jgi:hypothetical protein